MEAADLELASRPSSTSKHPGAYAEDSAAVVEAAVARLQQGGAATRDLAGSGFTYRHDWGDRNGSWKLFLNWNAINGRSRVFVAISEGAAGGPDAGKFIGAAKFSLFNVAPTNGGVDIWFNIDWSSPIRLYADYLVINV
ncbi:MAG TPA: hypothetical protein VM891_12550 [Amaricoccus sp.]|nr:hypothetical protein [Amaricoccus sp.]